MLSYVVRVHESYGKVINRSETYDLVGAVEHKFSHGYWYFPGTGYKEFAWLTNELFKMQVPFTCETKVKW